MNRLLKNEKLWYFLAGMAAAIVGKRVLASKKTRQLAVTGLAKGMKLQSDAMEAFQNMKDEAADICYDAKMQAQQDDETLTGAKTDDASEENAE